MKRKLSLSPREARRLERDNAARTAFLEEVPREQWPPAREGWLYPTRILRSRHYLVQEYGATEPALCRLSITRTNVKNGDWEDRIPWEELQRIKDAIGYRDHDAVELYPRARDVVKDANMRHLWVLRDPCSLAWRLADGSDEVAKGGAS